MPDVSAAFFGERCYGFRFEIGFRVHLLHLAENAFQHTVHWGVGSRRVAMAEDLLEASSPLSCTITEINFNVFWTLISHRAQNK